MIRKLFSQLINFSNSLVQAEAAFRMRAERSAYVDLAIILHSVEAPCCHPESGYLAETGHVMFVWRKLLNIAPISNRDQ